MTTYPLEPLAAHLGITLGQTGGHQPGQDPTGVAALVDRLGISTTRIHQLRRSGLTDTQADRYACHVGKHPSDIWPTWWRDAPDELPPAAALNAAKTHCPQGHEYDHVDATGRRRCRKCRHRAVSGNPGGKLLDADAGCSVVELYTG